MATVTTAYVHTKEDCRIIAQASELADLALRDVCEHAYETDLGTP